jgi:hypothetical protein
MLVIWQWAAADSTSVPLTVTLRVDPNAPGYEYDKTALHEAAVWNDNQNIVRTPTDEASVGGKQSNLCDHCDGACGKITMTFTTSGRARK